ncbi:hypothetical protein chiPu_0028892 [Chiloscyllium punctatum]|uniref:Uncharacterized protein n=1 Tax=Chiloscyllium punctatum TaxID=137246 RepID=A0A401TQA2_CHIPU|nr:hypothetical protein [Chiloscyllium punctatum]
MRAATDVRCGGGRCGSVRGVTCERRRDPIGRKRAVTWSEVSRDCGVRLLQQQDFLFKNVMKKCKMPRFAGLGPAGPARSELPSPE